jgi:hypothetical protein
MTENEIKNIILNSYNLELYTDSEICDLLKMDIKVSDENILIINNLRKFGDNQMDIINTIKQ